MDKHTYCVIMAGGIGSRFWPKSRQSKPKQFLDILGTGKSFIRMTYERFEKLAPAENFLVVTNARYKDLVLEQIPELGPEHSANPSDATRLPASVMQPTDCRSAIRERR